MVSNRKKYMSKGTLLKLCCLSPEIINLEELGNLLKGNILTLSEFESGVVFLILHFLERKSISSILTSQKIASNLKKDHINKVREITHFLKDNL